MKRLVIGIMVILALLALIVFTQKEKIKKIQEIKQGAAASKVRNPTPSDKRMNEIIVETKEKQAGQKEAQRIADELTKKTLINCSDLIDKESCVNLIQQIAKDEKIVLALEKLNKAGVGVVITWYMPDKNQTIYINEYGSIMIHEDASIQDIKKFFGLV